MLRADVTPEGFHTRQAGTLPDRYGARVTEIAEGRLAMQLEIQPWMMADRKSTRLNSSHIQKSRMPSSA